MSIQPPSSFQQYNTCLPALHDSVQRWKMMMPVESESLPTLLSPLTRGRRSLSFLWVDHLLPPKPPFFDSSHFSRGRCFFLAASPSCNFQGFLGGVKNVGVPPPFSPLYAVFFGGMGHSTCGHEREKKKSFSSPERSRSHLLFNIPFVFR